MAETGTGIPPAVLVHDKSAIISWSDLSPFSDHLPLAWLGCVTCKSKCELGSARGRVLRVERGSL